MYENIAGVIPILGVAFEQGKILPTPETVPFRLTRDIVDGMGVMGVEGVYRRYELHMVLPKIFYDLNSKSFKFNS